MASDELFLTVQPELTKEVLRLDKAKYKAVQEAIFHILREYGPMTFTQLGAFVEEELAAVFTGSILWYYTTVKLDMEARGEIRRVPNSSPPVIELV